MNRSTNTGEDVQDLTVAQLGTVLYHIANNTRVSLDYTGKFKVDVLNRASRIMCNAIEVEPPELTTSELVELLDSIVRDTFDYDDEPTPYERAAEQEMDQDKIEDYWDSRVRQCVSDPTVTCHCTLSDQIKCEWSYDTHETMADYPLDDWLKRK